MSRSEEAMNPESGHYKITYSLLTRDKNPWLDDKILNSIVRIKTAEWLDVLSYYSQVDFKKYANVKTKGLQTVLHKAAAEYQHDLVKFFVEEGACVHSTNKNNSTALQICLTENYETVNYEKLRASVLLFLSREININHQDSNGESALHIAAAHGHSESIINILLEKGANPFLLTQPENKVGLTAVDLAAKFKHNHIIPLLLKFMKNNMALSKYHDDIKRWESTYEGKLFKAIHSNDDLEVGKLLTSGYLSRAADINCYHVTEGYTPLHYAVETGNGTIVQKLITRGANIDAINLYAETPLHIAVRKAHQSIIPLLLTKGASMSIYNEANQLPIDIAIIQQNHNIVQLFKEFGGTPFDNSELAEGKLCNVLQKKDLAKAIVLGEEIDDYHAQMLAKGFRNNYSLTKIDLCNNFIGDQGAKAIAEIIGNNPGLAYLDLSCNQIGDKGFREIVSALRENRAIAYINLSHNRIGFEGIDSLKRIFRQPYCYVENYLEQLELSDNLIGDKGATVLANFLRMNRKIKSLNLSNNKITLQSAEALGYMLRENQALLKLNLSNNKIESSGAEVLAKAIEANHFLNELDLSANNIGDQGAIAFANTLQSACVLSILYLRNNAIGSAGLSTIAEALKANTSINKLDFHNLSLNNQDRTYNSETKNNRERKRQKNYNNYIDEKEIEILSNIFRTNKTITQISLPDIGVRDFGSTYLPAFFDAITINHSVIRIDGLPRVRTEVSEHIEKYPGYDDIDPEYGQDVIAQNLDHDNSNWGSDEVRTSLQYNQNLCQQFLNAAKQGDANKIAGLIKEGVSPLVIPENENNMAIHWAAQNGHIAAVKCLAQEMVRRNINPVIPNRDLKTALELAQINNHLEIVRILLDYEAAFRENLTQKSLIFTLDKALLQPQGMTLDEFISKNNLLEEKASQGHQEIALKYAMLLVKHEGIFSREKCLRYFALAVKGSNADLAQKAFSELSKLHFVDISRKLIGMDTPIPIKIDGLDDTGKSLAAACHLQKADECMLNENFSEALALYKTTLEFDEKNVCALLRLGITLQKLNQLEAAKQAYQIAIKIEDKTAEKYLQQAKQKLEEIDQLILQQLEVASSKPIDSQDVDREELSMLGRKPIPLSQNRARYQFSQNPSSQQTHTNNSTSQKSTTGSIT